MTASISTSDMGSGSTGLPLLLLLGARLTGVPTAAAAAVALDATTPPPTRLRGTAAPAVPLGEGLLLLLGTSARASVSLSMLLARQQAASTRVELTQWVLF